MKKGIKTIAKVIAYNKTQTAAVRSEKYAKYKAGVKRRVVKGLTTSKEAEYELSQMRLFYGVDK